MKHLVDEYLNSDSWHEVEQAHKRGAKHIYVSGAAAVGKSLLVACAKVAWQRPILVLVANSLRAEQIAQDLGAFFAPEDISVFPSDELLVYGVLARSPELAGQRLEILTRLTQGKTHGVMIVPWDALLMRLTSPDVFRAHTLTIETGQILDRDNLVKTLVDTGYERVELIEAPGQLSVRGALVDIYPLDSVHPIRIDLFGDEVDSLRSFDITSQRTMENLKSVIVPPASETFWSSEEHSGGVETVERKLEKTTELLSPERALELRKHIEHDLVRLRENIPFAGRVRYMAYFSSRLAGLMDYLPEETLVVIDEPGRVLERADSAQQDLDEQYRSLLLNGQILPDQHRVFFTDDEILDRLAKHLSFSVATLPKRPARLRIDESLMVLHKAPGQYFGQIDLLRKDIHRLSTANYRTILVSADERRVELMGNLEEQGVKARLWDLSDGFPPPGILGVVDGTLYEGIDLPEIKLFVLTESEFTAKARRRGRRTTKQGPEGARLSSFRDLTVGDFVVHVNHGIGRYLGIKTMTVSGIQRDYIEIRYSGEDKLYVPTEQLHLVQKYIGAEGKEPRLHSLGGTEWTKAKARVRESVEDMAKELIELYAQREKVSGHPFNEDTPWQQDMEYNFPFQETPDQLKAIEEVKKDMETAKPMDRLLCGDVGYGKTEVAIRAAFKAVMEGKQVAVLVPTTILAQQHYNTFRERFSGFPVEISLLSRFRSAQANRDTASRISTGIVDITIGTHRLLSSDVRWKDLGLLIIDEEQRFGVKHKEKIKMLKSAVDVLTLTATPIPRTLHMAMIGLRDVSVIETPPEDRYPVQTFVIEHSDQAVKHAIERELERGGQVYYVHNRVRTIKSVALYLQTLAPNARIAIGHGQMSEEKLEQIFLDFLDGEYDVLLSTTIIESGLDIPNVNTIIVEDADRLGLAQLYQLRGRVGRSTRVGYALFTFRPDKNISEVADKRLAAMREFTQLGAGFKIALRDLEIRGAGNLLGAEQHGFVASVGFDLYTQLLAESVQALRGTVPEKPVEVEIKLPIDAYFPSRYIREGRQKVEMYKKVAAARSLLDIEDILDELLDRYGTLPDPVTNLLHVARLRIVASQLGITLITTTEEAVLCRVGMVGALKPDAILRAYEQYPELSVQNTRGMVLKWKTQADISTASHLQRLTSALGVLVQEGVD